MLETIVSLQLQFSSIRTFLFQDSTDDVIDNNKQNNGCGWIRKVRSALTFNCNRRLARTPSQERLISDENGDSNDYIDNNSTVSLPPSYSSISDDNKDIKKMGWSVTWAIERLVIPTVVVIIPLIIAMTTDNVEFLVAFTGSYAGVGVQYVMPALLMLAVRKRVPKWLNREIPSEFYGPFRHMFWICLMFVWAGATVIIVTLNHIYSRK